MKPVPTHNKRPPDIRRTVARRPGRQAAHNAITIRVRLASRRLDYRAPGKGRYRAAARFLFGLLPHLLRVVFLHFRVKAGEATLVRIVGHQARLL